MALLDIKFRNTTISLESDDHTRLKEVAEKLNKRAESVAKFSSNATDIKVAIITALTLEDQVDGLVKKIETEENSKTNEVAKTKGSFIDTINHVAEYLENLADRIEKR